MKKIEGKYNPKDFEEKIYKKWEENKYFKPSMDKTKPSFSIVMPPPNVTGKLHMGHALDGTIQDVIIRAKRMQGYNTLWLPGADHASIATEAKVVEKIKKEGHTKEELGREKFLEEAWAWTKKYGGEIENQQKRLGCSCDWDRKRFTLDECLSNAVLEEFCNLYNDGLIYRGKKMINWCPYCHSSISDIEVEYSEEKSHLWHIRYQIKGTNNYVEVATTRPETMLGDTAVAVNPKDDRFKNIVGKTCIVPIVNREIPIIADEFVEMDFGTGNVKLTPSHDPNDYQAGLKHNLEFIEVFDESNIMNDIVPEYKGMKAEEARPLIVAKLKELGALVKIEDYTHNVGKCYRCHNTVEPRISEQWFVAMKKLAEPAIKAVKNGDIKFVPKKYEKTYFNWLENIQDWCISRQLWWGHRIPAYYCDECNHITVAKQKPEKCEKCGSTHIHQDEDTLDTWFSSALWPFSTMGWPNKEAEDYKTFYPTNCLVTAYDIIFFWVARMIFSGLYATGKKPFSDIVMHGLVRDSQGRKMSKSLGNGIDPLEVMDKYGTDSLRFSVLSGTTMGNDIKYMPEKLEQASNFANKMWNAEKFITMNSASDEEIIKFSKELETKILSDLANTNNELNNSAIAKNVNTSKANTLLKPEDKWIIAKLNKVINEVTENIKNYDLGIALDNIYTFIWDEFCDWYIEMSKTRLSGINSKADSNIEKENSKMSVKSENSNCVSEKVVVSYVLDYVFRNALKLLHPFMPFITAELYSHLVNYDNKDIIISDWPTASKENYEEDFEYIEEIKNIIVQIRNVRTNMNIHPSKKVQLIIVTENKNLANKIELDEEFIKKLGFGSKLSVQNNEDGIEANAICVSTGNLKIFMPFSELVDIEEEVKRLENEKTRLESEVERSNKILSNQGFIAKAPKAKVDEEREKLEKYSKMLEETKERLNNLI